MAKRDNGTKRPAGDVTTVEAMEQRVMAFAELLGRMAGTLQAKAEGWMDRETLNQQVASVRDGAAQLLTQLSAAMQAPKAPAKRAPAAKAGEKAGVKRGRSGGVVDAPGKRHRTPAPAGPRATVGSSQAAKLRDARPMEKTKRLRGRG